MFDDANLHLIAENWRDLDIKGKWLFIATLLVELSSVAARLVFFFIFGPILLFPIFLIPLLFFGFLVAVGVQGPFEALEGVLSLFLGLNSFIAISIAWLPLVYSVMTLVLIPGGFFLTRFALGARETSRREQEAILAALSRVEENAPEDSIGPTRWFVIDDPEPNAYAVGTTVYLTRELIRSPHLAAVMAHELGHINSTDSRLTLALRRLVLPPVYLLSHLSGQSAPGAILAGAVTEDRDDSSAFLIAGGVVALSILFALAGGGFGLWLLSPFWTWYWREREHEADHFAAECDMANELVEYLEKYQYFDTATPYFLSTHPYTELRIDRLLAYERGEQAEVLQGA